MIRLRHYIILVGVIVSTLYSVRGSCQDLMSVISDDKPKIDYTSATFKSTRIVIGQSMENPPKGNMILMITHHFGALNTGYENLFGLKQAYVRLGMDYGITNWMGIGIGLNTIENTWDGFVKVKALRQSTGARKMPLTLTLFANTAIFTTKWTDPTRNNYFSSRISYCFEIMIARKFNKRLSLQLMPAMVHKNLVETAADHNDIFSLGAGGRFKVSERVSVNAEYHYLFPNQVVSVKAYSSFSVGVDIETGGHVFQIFLTNSEGEFEQPILTDTQNSWAHGGIFLGFNITRIFTVFGSKL